jgi:hypothetical protein
MFTLIQEAASCNVQYAGFNSITVHGTKHIKYAQCYGEQM